MGGIGGIGGIRPPVFYPPPIYYPPPFYGGYWGAWGYYDDDWMWGVGVSVAAVAVTVAAEAEDEEDEEDAADAVVTTGTTSSTPQGSLPCNPVIKQQEEMTYYLCDEQHFILAYGGTGPVYIPVPAPEQP